MRRLIVAALALAIAGLIGVPLFGAGDSTTKSVTGNLEDSYCYGLMGAQGPGHKKCAIACAKSGTPVSLVEKGTGKVWVVLPPKNASPYPDDIINKMEEEVTISGKTAEKGGVSYIAAEQVK